MPTITPVNYDALVLQAQNAASAYYDGPDALMSDTAWDALVEEISAYEQSNGIEPQHGLHDQVAAGASSGGDIVHQTPMLSLDKVKDEALAKFIAEHSDQELVVEPKLDGLAVSIRYGAGKLVSIAKRGDGESGEDVTETLIGSLNHLPLTVGYAGDFEVRGEIYLGHDGLEIANSIRVQHGQTPFANARNGASGIVARQDGRYPKTLSFAAYDTNIPAINHLEAMDELCLLGFTPACDLIEIDDAYDVLEAVNEIQRQRPSLPFLIDGAVIKISSSEARAKLGSTGRAPRWAVAYKYPAIETQSIVRDIEMTIGKTGRLGLRAMIDPVEVDGSVVTYASVHNVGWLLEEDIRIGDTVAVLKANDVIPRVESPRLDLRPADSEPWTPPIGCPVCEGEFDKSTELWRCLNPDCSIAAALLYAASRDCLYIEGMGTAVIDALVNSESLASVADIFALDVQTLAKTVLGETKSGTPRTFGAVNARKVVEEIEAAKASPWNRVITSLSIRMTGRTMGRRLANAFPHMDLLLAASVEDLATVEGIAGVKAEHIYAGLQAKREVLERLAAADVNVGAFPDQEAAEAPRALAGLTVCVTGSMKSEPRLASLARTQVQELIEAHGGKASGSVSAKTDILVCGETGSSKWSKAVELGKEILTPTDFADRLGL